MYRANPTCAERARWCSGWMAGKHLPNPCRTLDARPSFSHDGYTHKHQASRRKMSPQKSFHSLPMEDFMLPTPLFRLSHGTYDMPAWRILPGTYIITQGIPPGETKAPCTVHSPWENKIASIRSHTNAGESSVHQHTCTTHSKENEPPMSWSLHFYNSGPSNNMVVSETRALLGKTREHIE